MTCAGSKIEGGPQQHIVEEHKSMYLALCQGAKSLGRAISIHKQVNFHHVTPSSVSSCGIKVKNPYIA